MRKKFIVIFLFAIIILSHYGCAMPMMPSASATLLSSDIKKESKRVLLVGSAVSESDCSYMWSVLMGTGNPMPSHERLIGKILERSEADILLDADLSSTFIYIPYVIMLKCAEVTGQPARLTITREGAK